MKPINIMSALLLLNACSEPEGRGGDPIPCRASSCGKDSFRSAIPGLSTVQIAFGSNSTRSGLSSRRQALEAVSPAYQATADYVDGINDYIGGIFEELEAVAGSEPEVEDETLHEWRQAEGDLESVLLIETSDERTFTLAYGLVEPGLEVAEEDVVLSGGITVGDDGNKEEFLLQIDFDAWTAIDPSADATGGIQIRAQPFAGGPLEVWYDFDQVAVGDEAPISSVTTYWVFEDDSGALEYLAAAEDYDIRAYVRWGEQGGRYDHHADYEVEGVLIDEIATDCWNDDTSGSFSAVGYLDEGLAFEAELDGEEASCAYGPLDGHPNPAEEFANLPEDGEWEALEQIACEQNPEQC